MEQVFFNIIVHLFYFIGAIFLIGFAIHNLSRLFYTLLGAGKWGCYITGIIGTPIHELSHALACLIFGQKINEIKLFQIDEKSGTLGYVNHSYNKKNIYHVVGNYFIGAAPILIGTAFLCLMMRWLLPSSFAAFADYLKDFSYLQGRGFSWDWLAYAWSVFVGCIGAIFSSFSAGQNWWIFMVLALCISLHMNLSGADIRISLSALPVLIGVLVLSHVILYFIPGGIYDAFVQGINIAGSYLTGMLLLSLVLAVISVILAFVIDSLLRLVKIRR